MTLLMIWRFALTNWHANQATTNGTGRQLLYRILRKLQPAAIDGKNWNVEFKFHQPSPNGFPPNQYFLKGDTNLVAPSYEVNNEIFKNTSISKTQNL